MIRPTDDRAQLMLVGAVAIAIILMGLVVVFNTVLFTDTKTASNTLEESSEAQLFTNQIRKEVKRLAGTLNESRNYTQIAGGPNNWTPPSTTEFQADLQSSISDWSGVQSLSHAQTGPVFVNLSLASCSCNMTLDPKADVTIRWETEDFSYSDTIQVELPDNRSAAPRLAARGAEP